MSHDLAVYVGSQPPDVQAAMIAFERLEALSSKPVAPSQPMVDFLEALGEVLPDNHEAWASSPIVDQINGDTLVLTLTFGGHLEAAMARIVALAHAYGLVCIDLSAVDVYLPLGEGSRYADHIAAPEPPADLATSVYSRFLRDVISPELRRLGFKGSSGRYRLSDTDDHALLGSQKDRDSSAWEVSFTVNLSFITADAWTAARARYPDLPKTPTPNAEWPARGWYGRLNTLVEAPGADWWSLRSWDDVSPVAADVMRHIHQAALPEFRRQIEREPSAQPPEH